MAVLTADNKKVQEVLSTGVFSLLHASIQVSKPMWILRYSYILETGENVHISRCLKLHTKYSIGRSRKNTFYIKNDKSISREHIRFESSENRKLSIVNEGKVTVIDGKHLQPKESFEFSSLNNKEQQKLNTIESRSITFSVSIGTRPNTVSFSWMECSMLLTETFYNCSKSLENYGVNTIFQKNLNALQLSNIDFIIDESNWEDKSCYRLMYSILNGRCKRVSSIAIGDFERGLVGSEGDFEKIWNNLQSDIFRDGYDLEAIRLQTSQQWADTTLISIGCTDELSRLYLEFCVNLLKLRILFCRDLEELKSSCCNKINTTNCILMKDNKYENNQVETIPVGMIEVPEFLETLKENNYRRILIPVATLLETYKAPVVTPNIISGGAINSQPIRQSNAGKGPNKEKDDNPPVKKRRLNRPRVQPLNSLSFFVGGKDNLDDKNKSTAEIAISNNNDNAASTAHKHSPPTKSHEKNIIESIPEDHIDTEISSTNVKRNSLAVGSTLDIPVENLKENPDSIVSQITATEATNNMIEYGNEILKQNKIRVSENQASPEKEDSSNNGTSVTTEASALPAISIARPKTLVDVIQQTKNTEVERVKSEVAEVHEVELTESALKDFSNLEIVENPSLVVRTDKYHTQATPGPWNGRKNFKKFNKVWPKARKGNDPLINTAFLLTRNYVSIKEYGTKDSTDKSQPIREKSHEPQISEPPSIPNLDDDGRLLLEMQQNLSASKNLEDISVGERIESEEDDNESFSFSRAPSNSNGLFVENEEEEEDEIDRDNHSMTRNTDILPTAAVTVEKTPSPVANTTRQSTARSRTAVPVPDSQSDSDDDDEGPKFKFRRRM